MQCSAYLSRGGICRSGICVCAEGYYYIHGKCRAYSGLLEKCQEDGDCYVNGDFQASRCINNICNCSPGYYQRKYRTCRPDAKVHGKRCIINNDCKGWINSTCDNYICDTSQTHENTSRLLYNDNIEKKKNRIKKDLIQH